MNMTNGGDDNPHLLAGAYSLNALDDIERRRFEAHLSRCASCTEEVESFSAPVEQLGAAVATPAPASLKARVLAEVDQTRQESPLRPQRIDGDKPRWPLMVAAAAVAVALVAGGLFANSQRRIDELETVTDVYQATDAVEVDLSSDRGDMRLVLSAASGQAVLSSQELAALDAGEVYQLWIVSAGGALPEATFGVEDAEGAYVFSLGNELSDGDVVAVTVEPAGGSLQPTTDPFVVSGPISI